MKRHIKILVFYIQYGSGKYPNALSRLKKFYDAFTKGTIQYDLCIIENNNDLIKQDFLQTKEYDLLAGDNTYFEFSAWDKALKHYANDLKKYDLIHFVTSALEMTYDGYLNHFHSDHFEYAVLNNLCIGHVDLYPQECVLLANKFRSWLRSCFFFIPTALINQLTPFVQLSDFTKIFSSSYQAPFLPDAPLCEMYQKYLLDWVTGEGINGLKWHSRFPLTNETFDFFKMKTCMIMNEQHLSIRIRNKGIQVIDVGYSFINNHQINYSALPHMENQAVERKKIVKDP